MKIRSLRLLLTLMNVLVLAATLVLCALGMMYIVASGLKEQIDEDLLHDAQRYGHVSALLKAIEESSGDVQNSAIKRLNEALANLQQGLGKQNDTHTARVFGLDGKPAFDGVLGRHVSTALYDLDSFRTAASGERDYRLIRDDSGRWRLLSIPISQGGEVHYVLQIVQSMEDYDSSVNHLHGMLIHLIPLALLVSVGGGTLLTGRSLRPIGSLAAAAETISADNLSQRLPIRGDDELARMAAVINDMLARLEASFETQGRFIADASHELRTPLTALKANTSLALSGQHSTEEYRVALVSADKAANRLTRLVNDLLFLSRSDARQLEPRKELVHIDEVVSETKSLFATEAEQAGITLKLEVAPEITIQSDTDYIERLLANLISNALRHTPKGGIVTIRTSEKGSVLELVVSDTGTGIKAEQLPYVFDRFFTAESSRARTDGGTGLGLSISKSIVAALGGSIDIVSTEGSGTTVTISLPKVD